MTWGSEDWGEFPWGLLGAPVPVPPTTLGRRRRLPHVHWTVNGMPVHLRDWSCNSVANGGFDQLRADAEADDWVAIHPPAVQGAAIKGTDDAGGVVYYGRVSSLPQIGRGVYRLAAQGEKVRVEKAATRLLYQSRAYDAWQDAHTEPFNLSGGTLVDGRVRKTDLYWELNRDETYPATGDDSRYQVVFWAPNAEGGITRVAAHIRKSIDTVNAEFQLRRFTGPDGAVTTEESHSLDSGGPSVFDTAIGSPEDAIILSLQSLASHTPSQKRVFRIGTLRVNGIAPGDTFLASKVLADVAARVGYDAVGVVDTTTNILPLDWATGNWAELLNYVAMLEDGWWRVEEDTGSGPRLVFDSWEDSRVWTVYQSHGVLLDLAPLEVFNQVIVRYPSVNGAMLSVTAVADPDPLEGSGITNVYEETLEDPQPNSTLANAVANLLLARYSTQRYAGTIEAVDARDDIRTGNVFAIRGGDKVRVVDFASGQSVTLRIMDVEYRPTGVTLHVEEPASAASLIALTELQRARGRRR